MVSLQFLKSTCKPVILRKEKQHTDHDKCIKYNIQKILILITLIRPFFSTGGWSIKTASIFEAKTQFQFLQEALQETNFVHTPIT